jgi:hypothetical protein
MTYFIALSGNLSGSTDKNHENLINSQDSNQRLPERRKISTINDKWPTPVVARS